MTDIEHYFQRKPYPFVVIPDEFKNVIPHYLPANLRPLDEYGQWFYRGQDWSTDGKGNQYAVYVQREGANLHGKMGWALAAERTPFNNTRRTHVMEWVPNVGLEARYIVVGPNQHPGPVADPIPTAAHSWTRGEGGWWLAGIPGAIPDGAVILDKQIFTHIPVAHIDVTTKWLKDRVTQMDAGRKLMAEMGRPYNIPYLLSTEDIAFYGREYYKDQQAKLKRDRKAAKKAEDQRRTEAGRQKTPQ